MRTRTVEQVDAELRLIQDRREALLRADNFDGAAMLRAQIEALLEDRLQVGSARTGGQPELTR